MYPTWLSARWSDSCINRDERVQVGVCTRSLQQSAGVCLRGYFTVSNGAHCGGAPELVQLSGDVWRCPAPTHPLSLIARQPSEDLESVSSRRSTGSRVCARSRSAAACAWASPERDAREEERGAGDLAAVCRPASSAAACACASPDRDGREEESAVADLLTACLPLSSAAA